VVLLELVLERGVGLDAFNDGYRSYYKTCSKNTEACLFIVFCYFFISFRKIQKLNDPKNEKLKTRFHKLLTFLFF
jgi:hypothetical protein